MADNPAVELPTEAGDPVLAGRGADTVAVTPELVGDRAADTLAGGTTVVGDSDETIAIQSTPDGFRMMSVLADASSATSTTYDVELPDGASLVVDPLGGVVVQRDGVATGRFNAPWAVDANGKQLDTSYSVAGSQITQTFDTTGAVFPVVADPHYTWGIITGTVYFNKSETQKVAASSAFIAGMGAFAPPPFNVLFVASAGSISLAAAWAIADGKCIAVKSNYTFPAYSGSQGDGYCR
ncbi:hypothetical protein [uncultured Modestobacter sp.]|uniref:hypothetical protein n=1 Tax=uncultured Modestobacter sp. TaxID=380048 RepID=UPI0026018D9B|nr:hypothetical protein [uncultured Modestobacter sp.]